MERTVKVMWAVHHKVVKQHNHIERDSVHCPSIAQEMPKTGQGLRTTSDCKRTESFGGYVNTNGCHVINSTNVESRWVRRGESLNQFF